jgi:hypothetical protein
VARLEGGAGRQRDKVTGGLRDKEAKRRPEEGKQCVRVTVGGMSEGKDSVTE